jgi:hypothetical protein
MQGVYTEIQTITPDMASLYLKKNKNNRPLKTNKVSAYARDMREGRWKFNGEAITFSKTGRLLNGQNRLHACVQAGIPFRTNVTFGIEDSTFDTFDIGIGRTGGDILYIEGEKCSKELAATLNLLSAYEHQSHHLERSHLTKTELLNMLASHPGLREHATWAARNYVVGNYLTKTVLCFIRYTLSGIDKKAALDFCERMVTGANLEPGHPILVLRSRLNKASTASSKKENLSRRDVIGYIFKAWNAYRDGKTVTQFKMQVNEELPVPR